MPPPTGRRQLTHAIGPSPRVAVWSETLRALGAFAIAPLHAASFILRRKALMAAVLRDLEHVPTVRDPRDDPDYGPESQDALPDRPLKIFISCAEPSGETHGLNLVRAIREEVAQRSLPEPEFLGLGSARLADLGVRTVGNPVGKAAMGVSPLRALPFYSRLLRNAAAALQAERPDVCIPVDSPALHVPLGRIAHRYGVPVAHFVTPQYWGWAPWRVGGYRQAVDLALTILPFEASWFERHSVTSRHVGHPHLDELREIPQGDASERETLVLLPGSRASVIDRHLPWMLVAAARVRLDVPDVKIVIPHERKDLAGSLERHLAAAGAADWVQLSPGGLHTELARARVALSVSGTVLIDLLHHRVPSVVIYRLGNAVSVAISRLILTVPWFSSLNLLAGREIAPEFSFHGSGPLEEVAGHLVRLLQDERERQRAGAALDEAAARLGPEGATVRAARYALAVAAQTSKRAPGPLSPE